MHVVTSMDWQRIPQIGLKLNHPQSLQMVNVQRLMIVELRWTVTLSQAMVSNLIVYATIVFAFVHIIRTPKFAHWALYAQKIRNVNSRGNQEKIVNASHAIVCASLNKNVVKKRLVDEMKTVKTALIQPIDGIAGVLDVFVIAK